MSSLASLSSIRFTALLLAMLFSQISWADAPGTIEEIIVTAQRRAVSLEKVPVAVTAIGANEIDARGILDYASYLATVPGAAMQDTSAVGGEIKFRGIGTGQNGQMSPTTAIYFDQVPVIHTGRNVNSSYDFRMVDIDRIEVLRGPQGQLYGANSLGGAIKIIPVKPVLDAFEGKLNLTGSDTADGAFGYSADVALNFPLILNQLGLRLVAYVAEDSGWYDNAFRGGPVLGSLPTLPPPAPGALLPLIEMLQPAALTYAAPPLKDVNNTNERNTLGARAIVSWTPFDRLNLTLTLAHEDKETDGAAFATYANPGTFPPFVAIPKMNYRDYEHYEASNAGMSDQIDLFSLVADYAMGPNTLTSVTSYWERTEDLDISLSVISFPVTGQVHTIPQVSARRDNPRVFTQELRLTSPSDGALDWLVGLFYQHIDQHHSVVATDLSGLDLRYWHQTALSIVTGGVVPAPDTKVLADNRAIYKDEQIALFGQVGYDITDTLHGSFSFRWFDVDQSFTSTSLGFQFGFAQGSQSGKNSESVFTPRAALDWQPSSNQLYYVSAAEGYRTGIINRDVPRQDCGAELAGAGYPDGMPPTDADTVWSYEVGAKLSSSSGRFRFSGAAYYTDWRDMQLNFPLSAFSPIPGLSFCSYDAVANVGDANTQGLELEAAAALKENIRLDMALSWNNSEFDTTIPALNIHSGDTIPFTPDFTAHLGLNFDFNIGSKPAFARVDWQYVGAEKPLSLDFPVSQYPHGVPYDIGDYQQVHLHAGVEIGNKRWLEAFVTNIFDEYGITSTSTTGGLGYPFITTIRPRTWGMTLRWGF